MSKGSKNRTTDLKAFRANYDRIAWNVVKSDMIEDVRRIWTPDSLINKQEKNPE